MKASSRRISGHSVADCWLLLVFVVFLFFFFVVVVVVVVVVVDVGDGGAPCPLCQAQRRHGEVGNARVVQGRLEGDSKLVVGERQPAGWWFC